MENKKRWEQGHASSVEGRWSQPGHLDEVAFEPFLDFSGVFCGLWPATGLRQEHNSCCTVITTDLV